MDIKKTVKMHYKNVEHKILRGKRMTRKVYMKGGRGDKSVTIYNRGGKKVFSVKKPLTSDEMAKIGRGTFIRGLFDDCK
jgi:hypothetical protein